MKRTSLKSSKNHQKTLSTQSLSSQQLNQKQMTQNQQINLISSVKNKVKKLKVQKISNLNHDYFYQHRNHSEELKQVKNDFCGEINPEQTSKNYQEFHRNKLSTETDIDENDEMVLILTQKLKKLEENYVQIQRNYTQKISRLKLDLLFKNNQSEKMKFLLSQLHLEQNKNKQQIHKLTTFFTQNRQLLMLQDSQVSLQIHENQQIQSHPQQIILPVDSKKSRTDLIECNKKTSEKKSSRILLKRSQYKKDIKNYQTLKSQKLFVCNNEKKQVFNFNSVTLQNKTPLRRR